MKSPFSRFIVAEESMVPVLKPGDRVITFNWGNYKKSDIIVFFYEGKCFIKRIVSVQEKFLVVAGDNKLKSKPIPLISKKFLIGKVIWQYS